MTEVILDKRIPSASPMDILVDKERCPKCGISYDDGNFKTLWIPPSMRGICNEIMQCMSCRHLFSYK